MKKFHLTSLMIGLALGVLLSMGLPTHPARAVDDTLPREEVDKKLTEILASQDQLKKKIEEITTQTQFLKASSGK